MAAWKKHTPHVMHCWWWLLSWDHIHTTTHSTPAQLVTRQIYCMNERKLYFQKNSLAYPNMVTSGSKIIRWSWPRWKTSGFKMLADEWRHCFTRLFSLYKLFSSLLSFPSSANQLRQITAPYWAWKCFFFPSFANRFLVEVSWSVGAAEEFLLIVLWSVTGGLSKLLIASSFSLQPTVVTGPRLGSALPSFCLRI